ncbi:MAG: DUF3786 domain-containing protein [Dehalococcoidales bacterium]|nr:DUF3786 domain-containing protein [Dehalococcoidales bacterium]
MEGKHLIPPDYKDYKYGLNMALKLAGKQLASIDIEDQCEKSGATLKIINDKETILLDYLGSSYIITLSDMDISPACSSQETVQPRDKLLMLHYFINADGSPPTGKMITYKEIPDGATYFPTFYKRAIKPLLDNFAKEPYKFLDIAAKLSGIKAYFGDLSVTINAFRKVPLIFVLWFGDDELAPEGSILFDSNITGYLSAEDITVLCEIIAWRLVGYSREIKS